MYLFLEKEKKSLQWWEAENTLRVFVPPSHKHICVYYLFWDKLRTQLFKGAQKRQRFSSC